MIRRPPKAVSEYAQILFPAGMLLLFFVVPFGLMVAVSFFRRIQGGFYEPDFVLANYLRFLTPFFGGVLGFSLLLAIVVSVLSIAIAFPFTHRLVSLPRKRQVVWLVFLLSILSLSEVIIGFAWSTLLSRTAGITNLLVAIGIMSEPQSWSPSFGGLLAGLTYQAFPYTVLLLYPALARFDPHFMEAARTLGASPARSFWTVLVPAHRNVLVATSIMVFVFALGSYLLPQLLGRPQHWTLSVLITDQAIYQSNMPFAAAMAVFLVLVSLGLVGLSLYVGRTKEAADA